jgi:cytochrome c oxidase subunit IV
MGDSHADISKHVKAYVGVFIALAIATVLTVLASLLDVSTTAHISIALLIAAVKASLVAAIFMHLKWERSISIWWVLAFCAIFFVALLLLPVLTAQESVPGVVRGTWN